MKISVQRRHAVMVEDGAFSHKIDYVTFLKEILNPEGHPNRMTISKVTAILLRGWILPIGGASALKGLRLQPAQQACLMTYPYNSQKLTPPWQLSNALLPNQARLVETFFLLLTKVHTSPACLD